MPLSVLYIHHSGIFGGASRSLLELIRAFPDGEINARLISQRGKVPDVFREQGIEVIETVGLSQVDHTRFGYYRGVRWLLLAREIAYLPFTILALLKALRQWPDIELIHVNEVTNAAAILFAGWIFKVPQVVHVRSVQQQQHGRLRRKLVEWLLKKVDARIAIDSTVRHNLPENLEVHVVHNGFSLQRGKPESKEYSEDEFTRRPMTVCFVGGLMVMKGILEFVQAAKLCAEAGLNVKFVIVGETPRKQKGVKAFLLNKLGFSFDVQGYCIDYISENNLSHIIEFRGFTLDIEAVYRQVDVLCFPSHLNAVGRPVIEAALFGVPSIVAMSNKMDDLLLHRDTGLVIRKKSAQDLFEAVACFYKTPSEISRMGSKASKRARQHCDINKNSLRVLEIYQQLTSPEPGGG
jgi:glycosyltransferase involved in cell wall biosynthesis